MFLRVVITRCSFQDNSSFIVNPKDVFANSSVGSVEALEVGVWEVEVVEAISDGSRSRSRKEVLQYQPSYLQGQVAPPNGRLRSRICW